MRVRKGSTSNMVKKVWSGGERGKVRIRFISGQLTGHLHTGPARHLSQLAAKTEALISPMYIVFLQVKGICRFPTLGLNIRLHLSQLGVLVLGQPGSSAPLNGPQLRSERALGKLHLGKPSAKKSAVFLTLFKKPLTPPPLFEHLSYFAGGVF